MPKIKRVKDVVGEWGVTPSQPTIYMGIDPGKNGGIAVLNGNTVHPLKMPETPADLLTWLTAFPQGTIAVIEQVGGYAGQGQPGSAMFNFGKGVGHLEMALLACKIPFEQVTPQRWQKAMGISNRKKTETKTQWKNRIKAKAQQLFPGVDVTLAVADALLIAEYCRRKHQGRL